MTRIIFSANSNPSFVVCDLPVKYLTVSYNPEYPIVTVNPRSSIAFKISSSGFNRAMAPCCHKIGAILAFTPRNFSYRNSQT